MDFGTPKKKKFKLLKKKKAHGVEESQLPRVRALLILEEWGGISSRYN